MSYSYSNIGTPLNAGSGLADKFLFAPVDRFREIKSPSSVYNTVGDLVLIQEAHRFLNNEGFVEVICAPFVNNLTGTGIGDTGSLKVEQKLTVQVPGSYAAVHEWLKEAKNTPCVVLIPDGNCGAGFYYQLGCAHSYCYISAFEFTTGNTKEGRKGYSITFSYFSDSIFLYAATAYLKGVNYGTGLVWGGSSPLQWSIGNDLKYKQ